MSGVAQWDFRAPGAKEANAFDREQRALNLIDGAGYAQTRREDNYGARPSEGDITRATNELSSYLRSQGLGFGDWNSLNTELREMLAQGFDLQTAGALLGVERGLDPSAIDPARVQQARDSLNYEYAEHQRQEALKIQRLQQELAALQSSAPQSALSQAVNKYFDVNGAILGGISKGLNAAGDWVLDTIPGVKTLQGKIDNYVADARSQYADMLARQPATSAGMAFGDALVGHLYHGLLDTVQMVNHPIQTLTGIQSGLLALNNGMQGLYNGDITFGDVWNGVKSGYNSVANSVSSFYQTAQAAWKGDHAAMMQGVTMAGAGMGFIVEAIGPGKLRQGESVANGIKMLRQARELGVTNTRIRKAIEIERLAQAAARTGQAAIQTKLPRVYLDAATIKSLGPAPAGMKNAHLHHILEVNGRVGEHRALVREGQDILREYGIDPLRGKREPGLGAE